MNRDQALLPINMDAVAVIVGGGNTAFQNNYRDAAQQGYFDDAITIGDLCRGYLSHVCTFVSLIGGSHEDLQTHRA